MKAGLKLILANPGQFHQVALQTGFEGSIAMYRNGKPERAALTPIDTAISSIRSLPPGDGGAISMARQPSMASRRLAISSAMVSPCVTQPGMAGTSAQKPPSSASWMTALIFMEPAFHSHLKIAPHAAFARSPR